MAYLSRPDDPSSEQSLKSLQLTILEHWKENQPEMLEPEEDWNPKDAAMSRAKRTVQAYRTFLYMGKDQAWSEAMREVALRVSQP